MQLVPKLRTPVTAIRVTEDLLIKAGNWLIIFPGDVLGQMSDDEVKANFIIPDDDPPMVVPREPPRRSFAKAPSGPLMQRAREASAQTYGKRVVKTAMHGFQFNGVSLGAQMIRVLDVLFTAAGRTVAPLTTTTLRNRAHENDRNQVSTRLGEAEEKGLVTTSFTADGVKEYTLTPRGLDVVDRFGEAARPYAVRHQAAGATS